MWGWILSSKMGGDQRKVFRGVDGEAGGQLRAGEWSWSRGEGFEPALQVVLTASWGHGRGPGGGAAADRDQRPGDAELWEAGDTER